MLPPVYLLLALILMLGLHSYAPGVQWLEFPLRWLGAAIILAGLGLIVWIAGSFRRAGTTIKPFQESSALLRSGPYRFSRNPIYVGLVSILLGVGILLGSLTPLLVIPLFALLLHFRFVLEEERMLEVTFGAEYADYKHHVRRWL